MGLSHLLELYTIVDGALMERSSHVRIGRISAPFDWQEWVIAAVTAALFIAVFVMRLAVSGTGEPITVLYVFPIALFAVTFGRRGGIIAGMAGVLLVVVWVGVEDVPLTPLGWLGLLVPLLLLGVLLGDETDQRRLSTQTERSLFVAHLREREAAEINDEVLQRLAVAKWSLEAGQIEHGIDLLTDTMLTTEALVGALLRGEPLNGADTDPLRHVPAGTRAVYRTER